MKIPTLVHAIAVAMVASPLVEATVFLATRKDPSGGESQVAWTNGTPDPCSGFTKIVDGTANPCGIDFFVDGNNGPFTFEGCGGVGLSLERNHQFNSNCVFQNTQIHCPDGTVIGVSGRFACS